MRPAPFLPCCSAMDALMELLALLVPAAIGLACIAIASLAARLGGRR